jgi:Tfp pilus assembly PilM family ATPase
MTKRSKKTRSPIGLDIGARRVKAVQLEPTKGDAAPTSSGWRVAAATSFDRATPGQPVTADEALRLADTLDRLGFTGTRVVLAAPSDKLISGMLELPKSGGQIPLDQIARVELARTNKVPPESFEMGCWELPVAAKAGKAVQVMAVGYPHADATQLLDLVENAGLDAVALDVRSCTLTRACAAIVAPPPGITALLDLGWGTSSLVLVYSNMVVYVRALTEMGVDHIYDMFAKRLKLETELSDYLLAEVGLREAANSKHNSSETSTDRIAMPSEARSLLANYADGLVRELLVSFSYAARQYTDASVTRLLLMGAGASIPGLGEHLAKELSLETTSVCPRDLIECPPGLLEACSSPELTPALGLAQFPET